MTLNPERLLKLVGQLLREMEHRLEKAFDHRFELVRVDADLRVEQAHNMLREVQAIHEASISEIDDLRLALEQAQREKAEQAEQLKKAWAERPEHVGPFQDGTTYRKNQMVTADGSTFICAADETTSDPLSEKAEGWRLLAARGKRGATGATGAAGKRGEKGEKGDPGRPGAEGPQGKAGERGPRGEPGIPGKKGEPGENGREIVAADIVGTKLVLTLNDGEMLRVDFGKAMQ